MFKENKGETIFVPNRKCVINTDLDGLLSGMLLQEFLNWEVVGFSSCCGKETDDLWLKEGCSALSDYVFVDLPVATPNIAIIDQHFVAFDDESVARFNNCDNKINPNIMRGRVFTHNDYVRKYPFGAVHFILASLERLNLLPQTFVMDFNKRLGNYDLADLFLRADRVIGNTCSYTPNCLDWCNWIMEYGGNVSKSLFNLVKAEHADRLSKERCVEQDLRQLGCNGLDGECSNLFRAKDVDRLTDYFAFLSDAFSMRPLPLFEFVSYGNLWGERLILERYTSEQISNLLKQDDLFSYAFVTKTTLSVTYQKKDAN